MGANLSEGDARQIARGVVTALRTFGVAVSRIGVHLERDGFWFMAEIGGRMVWARTGQGQFRYREVAAELAAAALNAAANPAVHVA